ncbi:hypothetical protein HPB50_014470 [Hyalomma asiaticum]|uniref:Uncharacterized protein n=1 Tax=Hyalomma asiaticum TaxID=266040 RepID=A0ACB7SA02_HYAAI|nr:hypothetical protein HPB50_014470 [Hyalomma asiaticum]
MNVVRVEGMELLSKELGKEQRWCKIKRNTKKAAPTDGDPATNQPSVAAYTMRAKHYVRKITKASRMPNLPTDGFKIVVRSRNGFNVSNYQKDRIHCCMLNAAGVGRDTAEEDSICVNERRNVIVVSTLSEHRARRNGGICKQRFTDREFEASAYTGAAENTSKRLIRGIPLDEGSADVVKRLEKQPKYKSPYLGKRRQWERSIRQEAEAAYSSSITDDCTEDGAYRRHTPARRGGGDSLTPSRGHRARSRTRSRTRSRIGSRPCSATHRSGSTARMGYAAVAEGGGGSKPSQNHNRKAGKCPDPSPETHQAFLQHKIIFRHTHYSSSTSNNLK